MSSLLEMRDVTGGYGAVTVLRGIDLTVEEGEVVVVLGANGAGKTTTLRAITGEIATQGSVTFDGVDLPRSPERVARAGIATVPSEFAEPGADATAALEAFLAAYAPGRDDFEFVIKPCVGAGSRDAQRHVASAREAAVAHLQRLLAAGRSALLQPYLARVDEQ